MYSSPLLPLLAAWFLVLGGCSQESGPTERDLARTDALYEQALEEANAGRNLDAVALLTDALTTQPQHEASHRLRAVLGERVSHFSEVIESAEWLLERFPNDEHRGELLARVVRCALNDGRMDIAQNGLKRLERSEPDSARTAVLWARLHLEKGDMPKAKRSARRAVRLEPVQTVGHHILGLVLEEEADTEEAILSFRRAINVDPGHLGARDHLATLLLRTKRTKEANKHRTIHTAIIRATPGGFRHFPPTERVVTFTDVVELLPEWQLGHMELARALMQAQHLEDARDRMRIALRIDPRSPEAHELMSTILQGLGDEQGARRHGAFSRLPGDARGDAPDASEAPDGEAPGGTAPTARDDGASPEAGP